MDGANEEILQNVFETLSASTKKPITFLGVQDDVAERLKVATKKLYDLTKTLERSTDTDALTELIIEGFDEEQVWQEIELQNDPCIGDIVADVSEVAASKVISFQSKFKENAKPKSESDKSKTLADIAEDVYTSEEDEGLEEEEDEEDTPLTFELDNEGDLSDEEQELEDLLQKAEGNLPSDEDSANGSGESLDGDFELNMQSLSALKSKNKNEKVAQDKQPQRTVKKRKTEVDDKFFKMADMEEFLEQEDAREEKKQSGDAYLEGSDEEGFDYFVDIPSDESDDDEEIHTRDQYEDFFDPPQAGDNEAKKPQKKKMADNKTKKPPKKKVKFTPEVKKEDSEEDEDQMEEDDKSSSEGEDVTDILGPVRGQKSSFEKRQQKIQHKIDSLEAVALDTKSWQLTGEVGSESRPENSLLEQDLDYEHNSRLAPVITEETTKLLEDIIKQRIKDKAWDDVERKVKTKENAFEYKKRIVLDQEKSKLSLGDIYEQEYIKQQQTEEEEKDDPKQEEIEKSMQALFIKLDALSNYHYTPKQAAAEIKIVSNLPSVMMEEVAPVSTSGASMLAPKEIKEKDKGELKGTSEKSQTDRKHDRRDKKKRQKVYYKGQEEKQKRREEKGLNTKEGKEKAMKELEKQSKSGKSVHVIKEDKTKKSGLKSSTQFFDQLQEEVTAHIQSKKGEMKQKKKVKDKSVSKYKL